MNIRVIARRLGGDVAGRNRINCPGPGHSRRDRSLSVTFTNSGFLVHSFAGDDFRVCRDHIKALIGIADQSTELPVLAAHAHCPADTRALAIWREAVPIEGTMAEIYLNGRGLLYRGNALRWHPSCPFGEIRHGCMIGLYRDICTDEPKAIHRTAIDANGRKIDRRALGPKRGCAIKLTPNEHVTTSLTISEGIETAIAGMAAAFAPAWALGDAGEIERFPVLAGIECLTILTDNDETGKRAALACSERWTASGREVFRVVPKMPGADFADIIAGRAA